MPPLGEILTSLYGAFRLALFDKKGLACFNISRDGFWHSFFGAVVAFPTFVIFVLARYGEVSGGTHPVSFVRYILIEGVFFVIAWLAYPVLMLTIVGLLDRQNRYLDYMVPYNWCIGLQSVIYLPLGLLVYSGVVSPQAGAFFTMLFWSYIISYSAFVAHHGLKVPWINVAGVVALDIILTIILETISTGALLR